MHSGALIQPTHHALPDPSRAGDCGGGERERERVREKMGWREKERERERE